MKTAKKGSKKSITVVDSEGKEHTISFDAAIILSAQGENGVTWLVGNSGKIFTLSLQYSNFTEEITKHLVDKK